MKKISILTDKPISPIVTKDLQQLLLKDGCPLEKAIHLLLIKHRCDLLIYLYENHRTPATLSFTKGMIKSIRENILQYKKEEVSKFYLLVLSEIDNEKEQLEIGYSNIIEMVLKKPNL